MNEKVVKLVGEIGFYFLALVFWQTVWPFYVISNAEKNDTRLRWKVGSPRWDLLIFVIAIPLGIALASSITEMIPLIFFVTILLIIGGITAISVATRLLNPGGYAGHLMSMLTVVFWVWVYML